ncbi:MAG TPA: DpnI domain-containing protein [Edaphobacter sp.]
MLLPTGDITLAKGYASGSQRARIITEAWVKQHGYCIACESDRLRQTSANTQARDFECLLCGHAYELKSSASAFGKRITDGAYASMMRRINNATVSSLLLLQYTPAWEIANLSVIHDTLITSKVIEQRKALAPTARRAGWVGCNILLSCIPPEGRIPLVINGQSIPKHESRARFAVTERLSTLSPISRGWAASVLRLLHGIGKERFSIDDAYSLELELSSLFPKNRHVRPKIRQQLQVLRGAGLITFESRGYYRFTNSGGGHK